MPKALMLMKLSKTTYALYMRMEDMKEFFMGIYSLEEAIQLGIQGAKVEHEQ